MKRLHILMFFATPYCMAQYEPAAGLVGTSAIHKDSSIIINWATSCTVERGYMDISNPTLGLASTGDEQQVLGHADGFSVVSLGDAGKAMCRFQKPIANGIGYDFVVFENSFSDSFLEFAFVEVSSNGVDFVRFPNISLTDTVEQISGFDSIETTRIHNLAGKYRASFGTPFDLEELANDSLINIDSITQVRIIDVVGSITNSYASRDSQYHKINDPWQTPFASSGFDLEAVGVIHQNESTFIEEENLNLDLIIYPNPTIDFLHISASEAIDNLYIYNFRMELVKKLQPINATFLIDIKELQAGFYFITLEGRNDVWNRKFVKR